MDEVGVQHREESVSSNLCPRWLSQQIQGTQKWQCPPGRTISAGTGGVPFGEKGLSLKDTVSLMGSFRRLKGRLMREGKQGKMSKAYQEFGDVMYTSGAHGNWEVGRKEVMESGWRNHISLYCSHCSHPRFPAFVLRTKQPLPKLLVSSPLNCFPIVSHCIQPRIPRALEAPLCQGKGTESLLPMRKEAGSR